MLLVSRGSALAAGAVLGVGLWIKFPAILAAPALLLAFPRGADRLRFAASLIVVGVASYVPALLRDAEVVVRSVFLYGGLQIQSPAGVRIWGTQLFYHDDALAPGSSHGAGGLFRALLRNNTWICVAPIALVAWARRDGRSRLEIACNVGASYAIFHGLTNFWAWQYLAWALPLWWAAGWRTAMPACAVATVYVYVLYVWLCGDPWLAGSWDWLGKPHWPAWLLRLREAAVLGFFATALALVAQAILAELRRARGPRAGEPTS